MPPKSLGEQNYQEFATRYAQLAETKPHNALLDRPNTLALLPDVNGKRVLDAGCGPGFYAEHLLERGAEVVAFDVTPAFVEITRERVGERARVLRADLNAPLPFPDSNFDVVLCPLVLDYIEDWFPVFREFERVLTGGGFLVFSAGHPFGDWQWLTGKYPDQVESYFNVELFTAEWGGFGEPKPSITSYRRPLMAMLNPLTAAGLTLDYLLEARPDSVYADLDEERYARLMRETSFIMIRARKLGITPHPAPDQYPHAPQS